jgi:hypothetical protein
VESNQDQDAPGHQDPNVSAFLPQPQQQQYRAQQSGFNNRGNHSRGQSSYRGNSNRSMQNQGQGSNAARNGKFCIYCKILNHTQEECRMRIKDNKPCVNGKGQLYWPKINNIETNSSAQSNNDSNNKVNALMTVFQE